VLDPAAGSSHAVALVVPMEAATDLVLTLAPVEGMAEGRAALVR
jgi:hypothetical protein